MGRQTGLGWVAEMRETGLSTRAGYAGVQEFRLAQFPFSLLYINRADYLWVVAVAHGSRKPGCWKQRVV